VSLYSAEVETAADIQATVNFAVQYNIKLAIKNAGHDFLGRSSAPNSLQLNTYKMKNITINNSFVPAVCPGTTPPPPVKAVTVAAGVQLHLMYEYLNTQNVIVVGGSANTVGIAGGYLQGGHSLMGWIAGMGSDNALEFQMVTASVLLPHLHFGIFSRYFFVNRAFS
jgi:FAD/FMN-containing dehydrogenase